MSTGKLRKAMPIAESVARASVTFPPNLYRTLERIARQKKVSIALVVREAADKYVADQWSLVRPGDRGNQN